MRAPLTALKAPVGAVFSVSAVHDTVAAAVAAAAAIFAVIGDRGVSVGCCIDAVNASDSVTASAAAAACSSAEYANGLKNGEAPVKPLLDT